MNKTKVFETDRLILRPFKEGDAEDMFKNYCNSEKVCEFWPWGPFKSIEETKQFLEKNILPSYQKENTFLWAIVLKNTNEVVGRIEAHHYDERHKSVKFGWILGDKFWGQGIMPEAATVVRDYLFDIGIVRISAKCKSINTKSSRVMQKIGMIHEGTLHKASVTKDGKFVDSELYAITK